MDRQIDWAELFFSAEGRAPRASSWLGAGVLVAVAAIYEALVGPTLHWLTGWFVYPALVYCGTCVLAKRLHDRGRSGWWAALIIAAVVAVWPHPSGFLDFVFFLVLAWAGIELGVMPGEWGSNRHGANPMRPA
jgi:uncharacterized membrane protein YhaH (DUF805 family)